VEWTLFCVKILPPWLVPTCCFKIPNFRMIWVMQLENAIRKKNCFEIKIGIFWTPLTDFHLFDATNMFREKKLQKTRFGKTPILNNYLYNTFSILLGKLFTSLLQANGEIFSHSFRTFFSSVIDLHFQLQIFFFIWAHRFNHANLCREHYFNEILFVSSFFQIFLLSKC